MEKENKKENHAKSQGNKKPSRATISELRQDLITGDWVVIATGRARRPEDFSKTERIKNDTGINDCFFEDPEKSGQEKDILIYKKSDGEWTLRVFPNKYPAFSPKEEIEQQGEGPYFSMNGYGHHEVIVTRDHEKQIAQMDKLEIAEIFDAYQERYLALMNKKDINFVGVFHNHGKEAGASIAHPHSQLMAIPVVSPYMQLELEGSEVYYIQNRHCVYCVMAEWEEKAKKRIVFQNEKFIAFCPFASRAAFEVWIMPKIHSPYFERIGSDEKIELAEVFGKALNSIFKALNDPPYNFYIHTSPCDGKDYPHFHWHIEILPHTSTWAGFELETGIEISTIQPEVAAEYLRRQTE